MKWTVMLFAHLREKHGATIEVDAEPTVDSVMTALAANGLDLRSSRLAADDEFVRHGDSIRPGATLAVIPPVSGG